MVIGLDHLAARERTERGCAISPARVAKLVERSPSKAMDLGSNPGQGHGFAVGAET